MEFGCWPRPNEGVSHQQARLIIEKYLREHPEKLHKEAGFIAVEALVAAFLCK